jgi:uncharacterized repeat protein (TIGR01451 family)
MTRRFFAVGCWSVLALLCLLAAGASGASAAAPPKWKISVTANADYVQSGKALGAYTVEVENAGGEPTSGEITVEDVVPNGVTAEEVKFFAPIFGNMFNVAEFGLCPSPTECHFPGLLAPELGITSLNPGERLEMDVLVRVPASVEGTLQDVGRVSGGGAAEAAEASVTNTASANPKPGILHFDSSITNASGEPYTQAGGHPYEFSTDFHFETYSTIASLGGGWNERGAAPFHDPKNIVADLPPGLVVNPRNAPHCSLADYFTQECEYNKVSVGDAILQIFGQSSGGFHAPIVNLDPVGAYPGELGVPVFGIPIIVITTGIRTGPGYGIAATSLGAQVDLNRTRLNLWGIPADEGHNSLRGLEGGPPESLPAPFVTMPGDCSGNPLTVGGRYDTWDIPGEYAEASVELSPVDGCNALAFEPSIEAHPTTNLADAPSGFLFNLHVPQNEEPEQVSSGELKEALVRLPAGLSVNPAAAGGLGSCSETQIGLQSETPAQCPDASKLGSAEAESSLLNGPLSGPIYLATPHQNPSGSLLAAYVVLEGEGIRIKLSGSFETDPVTGEITTRFTENPQLPFERLTLKLFEGPRGAVRTPAVCGDYTTTSTLTPFSAPESGPPATPSSSFTTTSAEQSGAPCPSNPSQEPNAPRFTAGTKTPQAGTYSPFSLRVVRDDGSQELTKVDTMFPPGLIGKLAGIPYCPAAAIAAASTMSGRAEQGSPSCPATTEVGSVNIGAGAGPTPLNVAGHAYLAGPYEGAPISLAIITPAVAGPFDLGDVVVRVALYVDTETTRIHAVSDPIPTILEGIPLDVRSITLNMARPNFTLNPTSCEETAFTGSALSVLNAAAPLSERFQVGGCPALGFKPKLSLHLTGGTKRRGHPAITAVLQMPAGGANISATQVALSSTELLDNAHIKNPCTRTDFVAGACPPGSVLGYARAQTPLLDQPLEGPVYLMTGFGHKLPDLVADLNGQLHIILDGRIDQSHGGLRTTFERVPDAPISKFVLALKGGAKGLVQNSVNLCRSPQRATATFIAQNGKSLEATPPLLASCTKRHHKSRHRVGN